MCASPERSCVRPHWQAGLECEKGFNAPLLDLISFRKGLNLIFQQESSSNYRPMDDFEQPSRCVAPVSTRFHFESTIASISQGPRKSCFGRSEWSSQGKSSDAKHSTRIPQLLKGVCQVTYMVYYKGQLFESAIGQGVLLLTVCFFPKQFTVRGSKFI